MAFKLYAQATRNLDMTSLLWDIQLKNFNMNYQINYLATS